MSLVPLATCAQRLGIHPKTLHHWLKGANFSWSVHPTDARIKCLAQQHLVELARLHGRSLAEVPATASGEQKQEIAVPAHSVAKTTPCPDAPLDLLEQMKQLQTTIVTLRASCRPPDTRSA